MLGNATPLRHNISKKSFSNLISECLDRIPLSNLGVDLRFPLMETINRHSDRNSGFEPAHPMVITFKLVKNASFQIVRKIVNRNQNAFLIDLFHLEKLGRIEQFVANLALDLGHPSHYDSE